MELLSEIFRPARLTNMAGAGSNPIDTTSPCAGLQAAELSAIMGCVPPTEAPDRLQVRNSSRQHYLPYGMRSGRKRTVRAKGMASLRVPDSAHLALFNPFPIWGDVKAHIDIQTRCLGEVAEIACREPASPKSARSVIAIRWTPGVAQFPNIPAQWGAVPGAAAGRYLSNIGKPN